MSKTDEKGMSLIVKTITRLTVGLIFLYGLYIVFYGHISHGGGFAGGVIVALSFIHIMLAYGKEVALRKLSRTMMLSFVSLGLILFLSIAVSGFTRGQFFLNFFPKGEPFKLFSAGIIPLCNIAIGLAVGCGLFTIFTALICFKLKSEQKK
jgi:multicomponent Na+:H+ antiporter subunit B